MLAFVFWGQDFAWADWAVVGVLVVLEGVLSIDNALVLGLLAKRLPPPQRRKALTYGLVGAFVFRTLAIGVATYLIRWWSVKLLGGGYLIYIAVKHLFFEAREEHQEKVTLSPTGEPQLVLTTGESLSGAEEFAELQERLPGLLASRSKAPNFWLTVISIELMDIAFAIDSILAAIGVIGPPPPGHPADALHPKMWVVVTGGILGVILMRFAAVIFIKLLERFPRFETAAYLLVAVIGLKLLVDWGFNSEENPHRVNFHDWRHVEFWVFWVAMLACFLTGFLPERKRKQPSPKPG